MSDFFITWLVADTFDINFKWSIKKTGNIPVAPTLVTSGPKNAIIRPILVYPNGGEDILTREIEISWLSFNPASTDNLQTWYEVFFTENFDFETEPDWKMIASVPSSVNKYLWKVGNTIRSKNVRVAVRTVNINGERSDMSISSSSFSIRRAMPVIPSVLSPLPGQRYGSSIRFLFDESGILNSFAQRTKYYIYFSSAKAKIPLTTIAQKIPVGSGPIDWDTSLLPPSDDYIITIYLADDDGNKSQEVNIRDVSIIQEGIFYIDTTPPSGYIQINNSDQFTRDRNVSVRLYSHDEITDIHSMQFIESSGDADIVSSPESFANLKYWQLSDNDGVKTLKVKFQDFAGNRTDQQEQTFRILLDTKQEEIVDAHLDGDRIWIAKNGNQPSIYVVDPNLSFITNVDNKINSITIFNKSLYIAASQTSAKALLYRWTGFALERVIELDDEESEINSITEYKQSLYAGCQNGGLYKYNESTFTLIQKFTNPIKKIVNDNSLLYIILYNTNNLIVFDGNKITRI